MSRRSLPVRVLRAVWISSPSRFVRLKVHQAVLAWRRRRHRRARVEGLGDGLKPGPVLVSGFLNETLGIGQGGRLTAGALERADFDVVRHDLRPLIAEGAAPDWRLPTEGGVWLMHCNPPEALAAFDAVEYAALFGRYRIGYWAWELPRAPKAWLKAARFFDEIWTPSQFTADSLAGCGVPVRVMPHPLLEPAARRDHARFGMPPRAVNFLAMADLRSSATRKNPLGAVEAFVRAYPRAQGRAALTVKIVQSGADPAAMERLTEAVAGRPDIRILTEDLPGQAVLDLIATADVLLSLHRAEGFGLTLSEALGLGRAALATAWSGNMEFMAGLPDALVPCRLVPVEDAAGLYAGQAWADPDLDAAAAAIRRLTDDAALRARIGAAGREAVLGLNAKWSREALAGAPLALWSPPRG